MLESDQPHRGYEPQAIPDDPPRRIQSQPVVLRNRLRTNMLWRSVYAMLSVGHVSEQDSQRLRHADEPAESPRGNSGKSIQGGQIRGYEHNRLLLNNRARMAEFRKMLRSPAVAAMWSVKTSAMTSGTFTVEAGEGARAEEMAALVAENHGLDGYHSRMGRSWEDLLRQLIMPVALGAGVSEYWAVLEDGRWWLAAVACRELDSIYGWLVDERERLCAVVQQSDGGFGAFGQVVIPVSQLLVQTYRGTGVNFEGEGILRPIWGEWRDSEKLRNLRMAAAQRFAMPTPRATMQREKYRQYGLTDTQFEDDKKSYERMLKELVSHERSYLVQDDLVVLDTFGPGLNDLYPLGQAINSVDLAIFQAGQAQYIQLGSEGGSYALSQTHASSATQSAVNDLEWVVESYQPLIETLVRWNWPDAKPEEIPRLRFDGIRAPLFVDQVANLGGLVAAGLLTPDDDTEDEIRSALELPGRMDERASHNRLLNRAPLPAAATPTKPGAPAMPSGGLVPRGAP